MFSKSCEYAIRATIFIATHCCNKGKVGLKEIANEIDSPTAFTAKILQVLVKNNIIKWKLLYFTKISILYGITKCKGTMYVSNSKTR